jgi:hypothetical protein
MTRFVSKPEGTGYASMIKVEFTTEQATKTHRGSRGIVILFL